MDETGEGRLRAAIEAQSKGEPQQAQMMQVQLTLGSTGRPFMMAFPIDISYLEALDAIGWIAAGGMQRAIKERAEMPSGGLEIARSLPAGLKEAH